MKAYDAVVVGGGLAGAAFAARFARAGGRALVLERTRQRTLKVCGDFLSAEALGLLLDLGLDTAALGASPIDRLTLAGGRRIADAPLPFRAAGLSRLVLDEALLDAAERAGATIERGVSVTGLVPGAGGLAVHVGERRYSASTVVLASGKHNLRGWPRDPGTATGFKLPFDLSAAAQRELRGRVQLVLFEGGYIGASLVETGHATVCWQLDANALRRMGPDWQTQLDAIKGQSPPLRRLLGGAKPLTPKPAAVAGLPFGFIRRTPIHPRVYPVGDQLAVIAAFTGDGTSIALASGIRAADALLAGVDAAEFQRSFAGDLRRQFTLAKGVSAALRWRAVRQLALSAMAIEPAIAAMLARATRLGRLERRPSS